MRQRSEVSQPSPKCSEKISAYTTFAAGLHQEDFWHLAAMTSISISIPTSQTLPRHPSHLRRQSPRAILPTYFPLNLCPIPTTEH